MRWKNLIAAQRPAAIRTCSTFSARKSVIKYHWIPAVVLLVWNVPGVLCGCGLFAMEGGSGLRDGEREGSPPVAVDEVDRALTLFSDQWDRFRRVRTFHARAVVERRTVENWIPQERLELWQDNRDGRIRCDYENDNCRAITILEPVERGLSLASLQWLGPAPDRQSRIRPRMVAGDKVLEMEQGAALTHGMLLALVAPQPFFHSSWLRPGEDPGKTFLEKHASAFRSAERLSVAPGTVGGLDCVVVSFAHINTPSRTSQWYFRGEPRRLVRRENRTPEGVWVQSVEEWFDISDSCDIPVPKVVEWFDERAGERANWFRLVVEKLSVNEPVPAGTFELARLEQLKPGQVVTWLDSRPYPCESSQLLIWDGEKLVCDKLGGPVAEIAPVHGTSILRRLAQWSVGLGAAGVALVLFRSIRRRAGRGR